MTVEVALNSERLKVRQIRMQDAQALLDFHLTNKDFLSPFDPPVPESFYTLDYWKDKILHSKQKWLEKEELRLIIQQEEESDVIGCINFTQIQRGPFHACRLGYKLGERFQGKGYMSEALQRAIEYMFNELNLHRIEANYIPSNRKSKNVLRRLGFVNEGMAKNYLYIDGKWQDHQLTSLTNPNWINQF